MSTAQFEGYVTDTSYADRFFRELSPVWLNYVAALNGTAPRAVDRPFAYLELGCGFGTSTVVNAGALPTGEFHACDLNPVHIDGGRRLAAALGVDNVVFHQVPFQALDTARLPAFDFIVLHGVHSWVGTASRAAIRRIIRRTLAPGGLVYVSYNCLPGWAAELPLRRLLVELCASETGDTGERVERARAALRRLSDGKLRYFSATPAAAAAVRACLEGAASYLVHEFLNETWEPSYSIDVADEMGEVGLRYVGSATLADNHPALVVSESAARAAASLTTSRQQQLALDFAVDRRFRRDVFVGESAPRSAGLEHLLETVIGRPGRPEGIQRQASVPRGVISFQDDFIRDLRQLLARGSLRVGDAAAALGGAGRPADDITRNLTFLVAAGTLAPFARACAHQELARPRRPAHARVERALAEAAGGTAQRAIPSEVLGSGVVVSALEARGVQQALEGDQDVASLAARLGEAAVAEGARPTAAHAREAAERVLDELLPSLVRLGLLV